MKITAIAAATIIAATSAHAELEGDLSVPVHRGMYCAAGAWHHGWLRPWERSPVIKASCGSAVYQMPH
jgi:hypothetical protein